MPVCTVVLRWAPGETVAALALRDELEGRAFDDPDAWWPDRPGVVGGRDRTAGGSWCVSDVATGSTAFVLNRPQKRVADEGAPSRGVLPLLAVAHGAAWTGALDRTGMASFALLLVTPDAATCWTYDGATLLQEELPPGTTMLTSGGAEDGKAERFLPTFRSASFPEGWAAVLEDSRPQPDPAALVVRAELEDRVYATVFGQLIRCSPGELTLSWTRTPWGSTPWTTRTWRA